MPASCEGRATLAALRFDSGDRVAAIRLADEIFVEADRPDRTPSVVRCAALAAAGIRDPDRVAIWLKRVAAGQGTLNAWIRTRSGVSARSAFRRGWFPWNHVVERKSVAAAASDVEQAVESLAQVARRVLDGVLDLTAGR